ncbi:hypothetical protein GCM10012290_06480 [Halolactibacillus alkaliphilus]|uniref:NADH:quinone oxidoreductase/Mrp antiporter transmembrane domain-containing protein n=1 Tax=Halolactibacillus alkaliphilus TaxID=442899 RepID=A0A511WZT6_9BACI|nr:hypothetical protein HAL01_06620 [Halolactibacillus alkaliphilus]GGN66609.1 hypothetical protein GCM10012290_06480 [Halolactibacillus alkaliphilus]SFO68025.1 Proton-conducting membrane transporter [Halolactibacillus alkaliphilus]
MYGILRLFVSVINSTDKKSSIHTDAVIITLENVGMIVIWLGIITMIVGVIVALEQEKIVRMLAYHSVSQMGYVIMGIGVAAYLGFEGAMGFAGALYHMINHGLFKALLFMVAAAVFFKTKEKNMYRLGGLYKQMPFTAAVGLIAVLGITGMPFFNGFASKSILHHAIIESYEYGHPVFRYAEYMFTLVSAGTAASFIKLYSKVFLGYSNDKYRHVKETYGFGTLAMAILAFFIIIGIFPNVLMDLFIIPAAHQLSYDNYFINNYLGDMTFFNVVDLSGMITVYGLGLLIYWVGMKYNLFHLHLPKQFDPESDFYTPIYEKSGQSIKRALDMIEQFISNSDVFIYGTMLLVIITLLLNYV